MIQRTVTVDVDPTPEELAHVFSNMSDDQQADFFSALAKIVRAWDRPFCFQLQYLVDHPNLSLEGKRLMREIGEYGEALT